MLIKQDSVWRNKEYLKFFCSFTTGNIGDWFDFFALQIIFAHQFNASSMGLSISIIAYMAPMACFGLFAGAIVDKTNKKHLLIVTDVLSGLATILLLLSHNMVLSLIIVFIRSTFVSLNGPAQTATLKYTVTDTQLLSASSYNEIVFQLCKIMGPLFGAIVISISSPRWCLVINAISFFVSALILLSLAPVKHSATGHSESTDLNQHSFWKQSKQAFHFIIKHHTLRWMIVITLFSSMLVMMYFSQMVLLLKLVYPQKENILGVVIGISGLGSLLSGIYLSRKKNLSGYWRYFLFSLLCLAINYLIAGIYQSNWNIYPLYLVSFLDGVGFGLIAIIYGYVLKKETPHSHMGRISGLVGTLQGFSLMFGALLGGIVASTVGIRTTFILMGIGCLIVSAFTLKIKSFFN